MLARKHGASMALAILCGVVLSLPIHAVEVESHNIPPHLTDCYKNDSLYHRENRLPSSMAMVVSLLRQIEESPGFTMDIRSFALSLLHMFRVDGVEKDPEVKASAHTIPFGLTGTQYYKFNLLMNGLIPRSAFLFPNETLNDVEKCSLHFMMSDSLDRLQRGDEHETCLVAQYRSSANQRRARRSAAAMDADDEVESIPQSGEDDSAPAPHDGDEEHDHSAPHADAPPGGGTGPAPDNPDAEIVDEHLPAATERKGDLMWNQDGANPPSRGAMRSAPGAPGAGAAGAAGAARRSRLVETDSGCPVENGVVWARWGSVQLGAVLAGIATGFETQLVQLKDLRKSSSSKFTDPKVVSGAMEIDNRYAATLAGDLAEVALWRGPKEDLRVGASGNWNSTQAPQWYFISKVSEMTDAEVRGGLDGLIMAHHVKEWSSKVNGNLKLSTVLERYYSTRGVFDKDYRACERQSHYKNVATRNTLSTQSTNFGYLLYDTTPGLPTITFEGVAEYVSQALGVLDQTIRESSQLEATCESMGRSSDDVESLSKADIVFIVDCTWSYEKVYGMFQSLVNNYNVFHPSRNTITVYGAKDYSMLFAPADRSSEFVQHLHQNYSVYESCPRGVEMKDLLSNHLRELYFLRLLQEKEENKAALHSQVVVIMPYSSYDLQPQERNDVERLVNEYRRSFPDVKFLVFAPSEKDNFNILVEDKDTDIITFEASDDIDVDALVKRLNTVHQRIANPTCGPQWQGQDSFVSIDDTIPHNSRFLYRIHSKYLFGAGSVVVKVQEENKGTVRVCHSRSNQIQSDDDTQEDGGGVTCSEASSKAVEIQLNTPCGSQKDYLSCPPLYLSVEATESRKPCPEQICHDGDDVLIKLEVKGLTCTASALASPLILVVVLTAVLKLLTSS